MSPKKNSFKLSIIITVIIGISAIGLLYLLYKSWMIFGFWRLLVTGLINLLASLIFIQILGSGKSKKENVIIYNPKEWPKLLGIIVFLLVSYYLFYFLSQKEGLSNWEYYYGISYLSLLGFIPTIYSLYTLVKNRNDYVKLNNGVLSYKDNSIQEEFILNNIQSIKLLPKSGLEILFKNESRHVIPLNKMNFNLKDKMNLIDDINTIITKKDKAEQEDAVNKIKHENEQEE